MSNLNFLFAASATCWLDGANGSHPPPPLPEPDHQSQQYICQRFHPLPDYNFLPKDKNAIQIPSHFEPWRTLVKKQLDRMMNH